MKSLVPLAKKVSALYQGGKTLVLIVVAVGVGYGWITSRASREDVEAVRQEQAAAFRKLDRWAIRHFGDSFLDEPDPRTTQLGAHGAGP